MKGFISDHISGLIGTYNVCGVKEEGAHNLFYDIPILDPVATRHFSRLQLMWPHHRSRSSPFWEWWAALQSYMGQMSHITCNQMNNWKYKNPCDFGDQVHQSIPQTTSSENDGRTSECFAWDGSDDPRETIEPPSCRQYKPGQFLAGRPLHWHEIMDKDEDDENRVDPRAPSGGWSRPGDADTKDDSDGEEDTQGGEKGTGNWKATKHGNGNGMATADWKGKGMGMGKAMEEGKGKGNSTGKGFLNKLQGEMRSLVPLLCSCSRKCMRQTLTRRANQSGYI